MAIQFNGIKVFRKLVYLGRGNLVLSIDKQEL